MIRNLLSKFTKSNDRRVQTIMGAVAMVLVLALVVGALASCAPISPSSAQFEQSRSQSVRIEVYYGDGDETGGLGSGVIVANEGRLVLTAKHVTEGAQKIVVALDDRTKYEGTVVWAAKDADLALIKLKGCGKLPEEPTLRVRTDPQLGEPIYVIGNPLGVHAILTQGHVASERIDGGDLFVDVSIAPGNSGGGVFDANGKLIGIVVAAVVWRNGGTSVSLSGVNVAIPVAVICGELKKDLDTGTACN
ncbi:MAG: trypsin-like serine protease [Actinobacteria bacterium]|nr:trypsin-like serine protease [Actinomycetota bacterium]